MESPSVMPNVGNENRPNGDELLCSRMVIGMAYVPMQRWESVLVPEEALARGTQFEELDKPFFGEDIWGCK